MCRILYLKEEGVLSTVHAMMQSVKIQQIIANWKKSCDLNIIMWQTTKFLVLYPLI